MVYLKKVDQENFRKVIDMKVSDEQKKFVAPNVVSIAQAWLYYKEARPLAIYNDSEVVGFVMLDWNEEGRYVGIWRFMMDPKQQGKGFGRQALLEVIKLAKENPEMDFLALDYVPGNDIAKKLYYSLGFRENGEMDDDEIVMILPIVSKPRLGKLVCDKDDLEDLQKFLEEQGFSVDNLQISIEQQKVVRYTIFGQIVGLDVGNSKFYSQRMKD